MAQFHCDQELARFRTESVRLLMADMLLEFVGSSPLDADETLRTQRAFNKLFWIQNDLVLRHYG